MSLLKRRMSDLSLLFPQSRIKRIQQTLIRSENLQQKFILYKVSKDMGPIPLAANRWGLWKTRPRATESVENNMQGMTGASTSHHLMSCCPQPSNLCSRLYILYKCFNYKTKQFIWEYTDSISPVIRNNFIHNKVHLEYRSKGCRQWQIQGDGPGEVPSQMASFKHQKPEWGKLRACAGTIWIFVLCASPQHDFSGRPLVLGNSQSVVITRKASSCLEHCTWHR